MTEQEQIEEMSEYKRLTKWETSKGVKCVKYWQYSQEQIAERLALLEDKIEKGLLVPRYSISQDLKFGWWCVCEVDEQSRIIAQCSTKEEAKRKLEELTNEQIYNTVIFN